MFIMTARTSGAPGVGEGVGRQAFGWNLWLRKLCCLNPPFGFVGIPCRPVL
jgi:hypothetical protein